MSYPSKSGRVFGERTNSQTPISETRLQPGQVKVYAATYENPSPKKFPSSCSSKLAIVTHAVSPWEFSLQYDAYLGEINQLMAELQESAQGAPSLPATPQEMSPCLAISPADRKWCRGKIIGVDQDGIKVHYVDYGWTVTMENNHQKLRQLEEKFSKEYFYAVPALLWHIVPMDQTDVWPNQVKTSFQNMVMDAFQMELICDWGNRGICVRLFDPTGKEFGQSMIEMGLAKSTEPTEDPYSEPPTPAAEVDGPLMAFMRENYYLLPPAHGLSQSMIPTNDQYADMLRAEGTTNESEISQRLALLQPILARIAVQFPPV